MYRDCLQLCLNWPRKASLHQRSTQSRQAPSHPPKPALSPVSIAASSHPKHLGPSTTGTICTTAYIAVAMPGSGKQSADVQQQIIEFLEAGIDPTTIHRRLKVGRSSIYRMKRCLQQHGTAYAPPETNKKNGRPKVMTAEQEQVGPDLSRPPAVTIVTCNT